MTNVPWWQFLRPPINRLRTAAHAYRISTRQALITLGVVCVIPSCAWVVLPVVGLPRVSLDPGALTHLPVMIELVPLERIYPSADLEKVILSDAPLSMWRAFTDFGLPLFFWKLGMFICYSVIAGVAAFAASMGKLRDLRSAGRSWGQLSRTSAPIALSAVTAASPAFLWTSLVTVAAGMAIVLLPSELSDESSFRWVVGPTYLLLPTIAWCWWVLMGVSSALRVTDHLRRVRCVTCGYDLRGTPGDRCSECGMELHEDLDGSTDA